jgi:CubicO group peptidase (beta-lactamase class C family)
MPRKLTGKSNYSNVMYAVAGEAAANVAGTSYEQLVHDKVINPLGLAANTGFSQSAMKKLPNHASPYSADSFAQAQKGEFREAPYDDIYMAFSPAGDLHSNVLELVKWGKVIIDGGMLDGKQVLNKENVQMTLTPQSIVRQEMKTPLFLHSYTYGLGWGLVTYKGHNCYTHSKFFSFFVFFFFPVCSLIFLNAPS